MVTNSLYATHIKRIQDIILATIALIGLSPLLLFVAWNVKRKLGSPVLFTQPRPGKDEKIFNLYKFRTMTDERDENGNLLPDAERLPEFGKRLRATSLDELPELINILKGDMSVVGPRPLLVSYLPLYNNEQRHRHDVRPGLTGLAQINGRNAITWEEKFKYDCEYASNVTFLGDWKIIFATIKAVLKHEGISAKGEATMPEFTGSK